MGKSIYNVISKEHKIDGFDKTNFSNVMTINSIENIKPNEYELLIDFTEKEISEKLIELFLNNKINVISGTTNMEKSFLDEMHKIALKNNVYFYHSVNFAPSFNLFCDAVKKFKRRLPAIEIVESHNITKLDAPSGSAKKLADLLDISYKNVKALRNHENDPTHTVIFSNPNEKIYLIHQILSRDAFIEGFMEIFNLVVGEKKC